MDPTISINEVDIAATQVRVARNTILTIPELKSRVQNRTMNNYQFSDDELYFWGAGISNLNVDTYFTAMAPSSLRNYANDAEENDGMAFQNSHRRSELNFGRSIAGKFTGGAAARTDVDFYTVRNLDVNGVNTDQLIRGMETGILKDVSIGFYGGWYRCSICGKDMFDWSAGWDEMCPHIPGVEYDITDKSGNVTNREVAVAFVEDAHASETSVVYDGACPGAAIRKAVLEAEGHRIKPEYALIIQNRYRVNLPGFNTRKYGGINLPEGKRNMPPELLEPISNADNEAQLEAARAADADPVNPAPQVDADPVQSEDVGPTAEEVGTTSEEVGTAAITTPETESPNQADANQVSVEDQSRSLVVAEIDQPVDETQVIRSAMAKAGIRSGNDPIATLRALAEEITRNRSFAQDGQAYRRDLIQETIEAGITAQGNGFDEDSYRSLLADAGIDTIKRIRDGFKRDSADLIPSGRQTGDVEQAPIVDITTRKGSRPAKVYSNA